MTPERTCVGCRRTGAPDELIRVVAAEDRLLVDERRLLPGRGAWLHLDADCLALADRRRAWGRALRLAGAVDASAVQEWIRARV